MPAVTPAIPASQIVSVIPQVTSAGGSALNLIGLLLTQSTRVPIGQVLSFPTAQSVSDYFGPLSNEAAYGSIYFNGFDNSNVKPAALLITQYNVAPVSAYLRGGNVSAITLAALQALSGTLNITIDGSVHTGTVNLSAATSLSNAAQIIGDTLNIPTLPEVAVVTGSIAATTLTVSAVQSGTLGVGDLLTGSGVTAGTYISALGSGTGGTGTYTVSASQTVASTTITATQPAAIVTGAIAGTVFTVSAVAAGTLAVGQILSGSGVTAGTYIASLGTGTGGTGTYNVSASQTVSSTTIVAEAPGVTYDSVSGGFIVTSATQGTGSTIGFATGALAASLKLTQATGAVLSQGALANTPGSGAPNAFMNAIIAITINWAGFTTAWEPSDADKLSFAGWNNNQRNQFYYAMWETNVLDIQGGGPSVPAAAVTSGNYSGIAMIYDSPSVDVMGAQLAMFLLGAVASIDFTQTQGRSTLAFKSQTGLAPQIFTATQAAQAEAYGINFYGDYTTANQAFVFLYPGAISGPFKWIDSYVNQIWLNAQLQLALMVLLTQVKSIPYNAAGRGLIAAACLDPILAAVNFGAIQPGVILSMAQIAEVNNAAGVKIDQILSQQGWYLQIKDASPQVRAARQSPPCTLWYMDGGSVQRINLVSDEVQ